jgi:hypothetical protein
MKKLILGALRIFGYEVNKINLIKFERGLIQGQKIIESELKLTIEQEVIFNNFRTSRYFWMNEIRWRILLSTGLDFTQKTVFEPGAGIGDQTEWLLGRGCKKIFVSEGRQENLDILNERFKGEMKVATYFWNIENYHNAPEFQVKTDIVFLWGVYYHIFDPSPQYSCLQYLSTLAPIIVLDYLQSEVGSDFYVDYPSDSPSESVSHKASRQTQESIVQGVKSNFKHAYFPREQMNAFDPATPDTPRKIIIGSKTPLEYKGLVEVY